MISSSSAHAHARTHLIIQLSLRPAAASCLAPCSSIRSPLNGPCAFALLLASALQPNLSPAALPSRPVQSKLVQLPFSALNSTSSLISSRPLHDRASAHTLPIRCRPSPVRRLPDDAHHPHSGRHRADIAAISPLQPVRRRASFPSGDLARANHLVAVS